MTQLHSFYDCKIFHCIQITCSLSIHLLTFRELVVVNWARINIFSGIHAVCDLKFLWNTARSGIDQMICLFLFLCLFPLVWTFLALCSHTPHMVHLHMAAALLSQQCLFRKQLVLLPPVSSSSPPLAYDWNSIFSRILIMLLPQLLGLHPRSWKNALNMCLFMSIFYSKPSVKEHIT